MNKHSAIIIGGSPFVNTVDLPRINTDKFDIIAINRQPLNIKTKCLIAHDTDFRACHSEQEVQSILKQGLNPVFLAPKTQFIHETTGWKWKMNIVSHEDKLVGFCMYTCSSAINFAYLKGYKNVYLVGVDLEENNKPFTHWHGVTNLVAVPDACAKQCKDYMYQYQKWLNLYQCNPAIANQWNCDYKDIKNLYRQWEGE